MGNKIILDVKEQALEKIKSLQKLEPDFVYNWLTGLIDLEQKIISVLYTEKKALTIKNIMSALTYNTYYFPIDGRFRESHSFPFESFFKVPHELRDKITEKKNTEERLKILKSEFKFPSFRRIDKSIQDLMTMGVVLVREEPSENKKVKGYYYLNPIIRTQLNKLDKDKSSN